MIRQILNRALQPLSFQQFVLLCLLGAIAFLFAILAWTSGYI